jgi:peptidoglycan/LPS O-acetylase OafA/YrhL
VSAVATRLAELDGTTARKFRHVAGLDGLRGIAVLLVVGLHYGSLWKGREGAGWLPGGFVGVDVFFVLSGFLITSLLLSEKATAGKVNLKNFYARRGLRLLPALYVVLIAHAVFSIGIGDETLKSELKQVLSVVAYVSNFAQVYFDKSMIHSGIGNTWSLAIEEQFYLVWPALLLYGVLRFAKTRQSVLALVLGGAVLSAVIRLVVWNWAGHYPAAYMRPDCRADGLLLGVLCAFLWRWDMVPRRWLDAASGACAVFLLAFSLIVKDSDWMFNYGFFVVSAATAVIVLALAENLSSLRRIYEWEPLRLIGRVSYGLYLWHVLALRITAHFLHPSNKFALASLGLVLTTIAVAASYNLVEQPFLRLKARVASPVAH